MNTQKMLLIFPGIIKQKADVFMPLTEFWQYFVYW